MIPYIDDSFRKEVLPQNQFSHVPFSASKNVVLFGWLCPVQKKSQIQLLPPPLK